MKTGKLREASFVSGGGGGRGEQRARIHLLGVCGATELGERQPRTAVLREPRAGRYCSPGHRGCTQPSGFSAGGKAARQGWKCRRSPGMLCSGRPWASVLGAGAQRLGDIAWCHLVASGGEKSLEGWGGRDAGAEQLLGEVEA